MSDFVSDDNRTRCRNCDLVERVQRWKRAPTAIKKCSEVDRETVSNCQLSRTVKIKAIEASDLNEASDCNPFRLRLSLSKRSVGAKGLTNLRAKDGRE